MKRSPSKIAMLATALALVASLAGCAFEDGEPWARADFSVEVEFDEAGRRDDGRLKTVRNYAVALDEVRVVLGAMSVVAGAADAVSFDPADPPEGYSLCHNGHCHSDDGRLVDYDEIRADEGGEGGVEVTSTLLRSVPLQTAPTTIEGDDCGGACDLPRGAITSGRILIREVTLVGTAHDTLAEPRLPEDGVDFELSWPVEIELQAPASAVVGNGLEGDVRVDGDLVISAQILDEIDFSNLEATTTPTMAQALAETSQWSLAITD